MIASERADVTHTFDRAAHYSIDRFPQPTNVSSHLMASRLTVNHFLVNALASVQSDYEITAEAIGLAAKYNVPLQHMDKCMTNVGAQRLWAVLGFAVSNRVSARC